MGGGVDLPKECFLGLEMAPELGGKEAKSLALLGVVFFDPLPLLILSELPLSFSLLELAELSEAFLAFARLPVLPVTLLPRLELLPVDCNLLEAPGGLEGFLTLISASCAEGAGAGGAAAVGALGCVVINLTKLSGKTPILPSISPFHHPRIFKKQFLDCEL